jgi:hypothetical protein
MVTDFEKAFAVLSGGGVDFVVIGGVAGALHGSAFITQDLAPRSAASACASVC